VSTLTVPDTRADAASARQRTTITRFSLIAAPILLIAGNLLTTPGDSDSPAFLARIAVSSGREQASIICFLFGFTLLVPAAYGLLPYTGKRGSTLASLGTLLTTVGAMAYAGLECSGIANIGVARSMPAVSAAHIVSNMESVGAAAVIFGLGLALPIGMILVATGLRRARLMPLWVPIATAVGFLIVMFVETTIGGLTGDIVLLAALGYVAVRLTRNSIEAA
jgi:hypothetical protein